MAIIALVAISTLCVAFILYLLFKTLKYDGSIVITKDDEGKRTFSLEIDKDPDLIQASTYIVFKVVDKTEEDTYAE